MQLDPHHFEISVQEIQQRLQLPSHAYVMPWGYEKQLNQVEMQILQNRYDNSTLLIRTRPDFLVIENEKSYFVEAKQKSKNVEAVQLLYNKQYEKMGIPVVYSFPQVNIHATFIPLKEVIIPARYIKEFEAHFYDVFASFGTKTFRFIGDVKDGSGDAFVPIDIDILKIISKWRPSQ